MTSLILEGGTFRSIFTAGVLDALLEAKIELPYIIGVSAGITNGVSYVSKQKGRNLEVIMKYRLDPRYMSRRNFIKEHSLFGISFIYQEIPNHLVPFDYATFKANPAKVLIGVTNAKTGEAEYLDAKETDEKNLALQATCSIPGFFPPCHLNQEIYYDGGIADPIPIRKAIEDGNQKHLIILTQPMEYKKEPSKSHEMMARLLEKRYPLLANKLRDRPDRYNATVALCQKLKKEGKALIIQPTHPLNSFEANLDTLKKSYQEGYDFTKRNIELIRQFIDN